MNGRTIVLCLIPVHLKWYHKRQESHLIEFSVSSDIEMVHCPQYHTGFFFIASTTCKRAAHPSWVKYLCMIRRQMFSSRQEEDTRSGLVSTSCSSMSFPASADSATSESTNQSMMTVIGSTLSVVCWIFCQYWTDLSLCQLDISSEMVQAYFLISFSLEDQWYSLFSTSTLPHLWRKFYTCRGGYRILGGEGLSHESCWPKKKRSTSVRTTYTTSLFCQLTHTTKRTYAPPFVH